jgi:hypothetical protein
MTPQILPTETTTSANTTELVYGPKLPIRWDGEDISADYYTIAEMNKIAAERREISYNRYLQNVANAPKVNYDSLILSALYEIIYYISNGLFEAFSVVKGDVTANVTIKDENDFVVQIKTPTQYFQICDDKDLFFTKLNVKTFEKLVGAKSRTTNRNS